MLNSKGLKTLKFLVVAASASVRDRIVGNLRLLEAGNIGQADSGQEAIQVIRLFTPDLILCTWEETCNVTRLARLVRVMPGDVQYVIVVAVGSTAAREIKRAIDVGVHDFLMDPFPLRELAQRIRAVVENVRFFVSTPSYFGPDRRRTMRALSADMKDRRFVSCRPLLPPYGLSWRE